MTSLTIRKGVFYAMEVVEKFGNIKDIEFWFIGNIESKIKGLFLQFLKKFSNVKYLGFISHYELHKYISQCDVGVLPSIEEGLAMVIPQMMACGLPVIATVNTGAEDLIENGKEGFIVPIMDAEVIAERIEFLYNNRDVCNELRNNALKRVKSQTWDTFTKVLLSSV
jgi:glycosyltransferase involved in cell wall biosynthesis